MAAKKAFRVEGTFPMGSKRSHFAIETVAADAQAARERVVSTLGSKHRANRHDIIVEGVKEIPSGDVTDPMVEHELKSGA